MTSLCLKPTLKFFLSCITFIYYDHENITPYLSYFVCRRLGLVMKVNLPIILKCRIKSKTWVINNYHLKPTLKFFLSCITFIYYDHENITPYLSYFVCRRLGLVMKVNLPIILKCRIKSKTWVINNYHLVWK